MTTPTSFPSMDLRGKDLRGVSLRGADLRLALLGGADLRGVDLSDAETEYASLKGATRLDTDDPIPGWEVAAGKLQRSIPVAGSDFRGRDMRGRDLRGADFTYVMLMDADLRGASLWGSTGIGLANLTGALRDAADPPIPGWSVVDGRLARNDP